MFDSALSPEKFDSASLVAAMIEATRVRRRSQFFDWSQGALKALIPHGLLLCGIPRGAGSRMFFDYFYSVPVPVVSLTRLCHASQGLGAEMLRVWLGTGASDPLVFTSGHADAGVVRVAQELETLGLPGDSMVHGIPSARSAVGVHCFFGFIAMGEPPKEREQDLAHAMVPHLFGAYCRALTRDRPVQMSSAVPEPAVDCVVTQREVEILRWVRDGKSNQEIGMILSISPLTVKNHVQKILRKLHAANRAQAVSKAISMRLLTAPGHAPQRASERQVANGWSS